MRVQINKCQRVPHKLDSEIDAYNKKWSRYWDEDHPGMENRIHYGVGICSCCRSELYGLWYDADGGHYIRLIYDRPKAMDDDYYAIKHKIDPGYLDDAGGQDERFAFEDGGSRFQCPICKKGHLSHVYYEYLDFHFSSRYSLYYELDDEDINEKLDPLYETMYNQIAEKEQSDSREYADNKVKLFHSKCDLKAPVKGNPKIGSITQLKEYIHNLIQLESNIISLEKRLTSLYFEHSMNKRKVELVDIQPVILLQEKISADQKIFEKASKVYETIQEHLDTLKTRIPEPIVLPEPVKPAEPEYKKTFLFNKKKVLEENALLEKQYRQALMDYDAKRNAWIAETESQNLAVQEQYHHEIQRLEEETRVAKENMESLRVHPETYTPATPMEVCPEKAIQKILESEIEQTENLLRETYKARNELYAANVIFGKYRELVALATFYEYLEAGRCTTLEGPTGAYNLYESEIRANMIIYKLSEIEKSLNEIERSQYMIYSQLTEMNSTLKSIDRTMHSAYSAISTIESNTNSMKTYMENISKNSDVIAHNTEVTAYYSKVNAELTNALGFMVALK